MSSYADFSKVPVDRVSRYYLARWTELYYGRNHATLQRDFTESLNFFSNDLQGATLLRVTKAKTLETLLLDRSSPNVDIEIKAVVLEDLRQAPYRAHIEFEKVFRSPGDQDEQRRERWTANVVYGPATKCPTRCYSPILSAWSSVTSTRIRHSGANHHATEEAHPALLCRP